MADQVISNMGGLLGAKAKVTLEIEVEISWGALDLAGLQAEMR